MLKIYDVLVVGGLFTCSRGQHWDWLKRGLGVYGAQVAVDTRVGGAAVQLIFANHLQFVITIVEWSF